MIALNDHSSCHFHVSIAHTISLVLNIMAFFIIVQATNHLRFTLKPIINRTAHIIPPLSCSVHESLHQNTMPKKRSRLGNAFPNASTINARGINHAPIDKHMIPTNSGLQQVLVKAYSIAVATAN